MSLAASWTTAVEYAMDNQLSGRGELNSLPRSGFGVSIKASHQRAGSTVCAAGCIDGDFCVLRVCVKKSQIVQQRNWAGGQRSG